MIRSNCKPNETTKKIDRIKRSTHLSAITVPNPVLKGILSYRSITEALRSSPERGMPKLDKYPIKTASIELVNRGLYPIGIKRYPQRIALEI